MSILYMNPGYIELMNDKNFQFYQNTNSKYTNCKQYIVPLDYKNWHCIFSKEKSSELFIYFDIYANLTNEAWSDKKGFLQITTDTKDVTLSVDSQVNLCLTMGDSTFFRTPLSLDSLNRYILHVKSTDKTELAELYVNGKMVYHTVNKVFLCLNKESFNNVNFKNIIYIQNEDNLRHGLAFSNFIISDMFLNDVTCDVLETNITSDWDNKDGVYSTDEDGKIITQNIDLNKYSDILNEKDMIYALEIYGKGYTTNDGDKIKFSVNDTFVSDSKISLEKENSCVVSDIMEINPEDKMFWAKDNLSSNLNMKDGVKN